MQAEGDGACGCLSHFKPREFRRLGAGDRHRRPLHSVFRLLLSIHHSRGLCMCVFLLLPLSVWLHTAPISFPPPTSPVLLSLFPSSSHPIILSLPLSLPTTHLCLSVSRVFVALPLPTRFFSQACLSPHPLLTPHLLLSPRPQVHPRLGPSPSA